MRNKFGISWDNIVVKFLVFTNPLTIIVGVLIGVFFLLKFILKDVFQLHSWYVYWFKIPKYDLEVCVNAYKLYLVHCRQNKMNWWKMYIWRISMAKMIRLGKIKREDIDEIESEMENEVEE